MAIGGWLGLVMGITFGGFAGLIAGGMIVDRYWKKRIDRIESDIRNAHKAPYEITQDK